jgi:hypothetical protein
LIVFRCFPWDASVSDGARGGALWFPRMLQGAGRHDNPEVYGCLYVTETPVAAVVERLHGLRGGSLDAADLTSGGRPLALAAVELADEAEIVDLDEPAVLTREGLRPSVVATNERPLTQAQAAAIHGARTEAAGIRWWSTFESLWLNVTLFDRAEALLGEADVRGLALEDDVMSDAARFLGISIADT